VFRVPSVTVQVRPWRQAQRAGTREDRLLDRIEVTIPPPIASHDFAIPADIATDLESSVQAIAALDRAHGSHLSALAGLLLRTESVASSRIEGISASIDDYARALHGSRANASAVAMADASQAVEGLLESVTASRRITLGDLLNAHRMLMAHEEGERLHAGRVRELQNWVGGSEASPRGALLVPPPPELLDGLLADLMAFCSRRDLPSLLQAAIAHAQFETIHPFTDGNGRIGRALINAILRARGTTSTIVVPLASALVARREDYFAALDSSRTGELGSLIRLFSSAARIAAEEADVTAVRIGELGDQWRGALGRTRRGSAPLALLDLLLTRPVLDAADAERALGAGSSVAYAAIERLQAAGILRPLTTRMRNQVWAASDLLDELTDLDLRIRTRARA
jgi:Fic family protein